MNKRSIVVGICVIAIMVCALALGRTTRFGSPPVVKKQGVSNPLVTVPGNGSILKASLNQQKELKGEAPKPAGADIPDYVTYSQLFRSVIMLKQKAEEAEKQGRLGSGYRQVIQATLKLDDFTSKELEEAAAAWSAEKDEFTTKADSILTAYETAKAQAVAAGKQPPPDPSAELQPLYEKLNGTILDARDRLYARLDEKESEAFEKAVKENIAANIQSMPVDTKNPNLPTSKTRNSRFQRQTEMPSDAKPGVVGMIPRSRPQTIEPVSSANQDDSVPKKPAKLAIGSKRTPGDALTRPQPQFNFCFFGGIVFYGTYMWLAPQVDQVFQLSFTQLDFCAGLIYDPYVYGELYNQFAFDAHDSLGRSFFRPAVVLNHLAAFPNTFYFAYAEHWLFSCSLEFGCGVAAFIDAYTLFILTPSCVPGGSALGMGPNYNTCPGPSPSPTPTPTVKIDSVGFTGDYPLRHWDLNATLRKRIDFPDGSEPTWSRTAPTSSAAVAYTRGTNPKVFATLVVTPTQSTAANAQVRVKKGGNVLATVTNVSIGGGRAEVKDVSLPATALESNTQAVKRGNYEFTWEVSFDNGSHWTNAGKSGAHTIYWTFAAPLTNDDEMFLNRRDQHCFLTSDAVECNTLYDEALQRSAGNAGGKTTEHEVISAITSAIAKQFLYDTCAIDPIDHPLAMISTDPNIPSKGQCSANANLLRGALRSIGINAKTNYYWGGNAGANQSAPGEAYFYLYEGGEVSFRVKRRRNNDGKNNAALMQCPDVENNPHFNFHALVQVGSNLYDPSYGFSNQDVNSGTSAKLTVLEVSKHPQAGFFLDSSVPADRIVERDQVLLDFPVFQIHTGIPCDHHRTAGVLFPNPIDDAEFFVAQHFLDFLNRDADPGGLAFWTGQITQCNGNPQCIDEHRVGVSLAFFMSIEFQVRGYFVQRFYRAGYGRNPRFAELFTDVGRLSPDPDQLEDSIVAYVNQFVDSEAFKNQYPFTMEHSTFVDALFANAGVTPTSQDRASLISGLDAGTENRATVLRKVVENQAFINAEFNKAFILMCYFGYLRRDPDLGGYNFWLGILNSENDLNHITRAFLLSTEYRERFGLP